MEWPVQDYLSIVEVLYLTPSQAKIYVVRFSLLLLDLEFYEMLDSTSAWL